MNLHRSCVWMAILALCVPPAWAVEAAVPAAGIVQAPGEAAVREARALVARVLPGQEGRFVFETIPAEAGRDVFEVEAVDGKIVLRGNSSLSLAVAFNWYLRHEAKANFDWLAAGPLQLAGPLPPPRAKVRQSCLARDRFFLNYCTYGYTLPWWTWEQWQRFVDWMAMNGVNRPLLQCGQEAVWLEVWKSYGLDEAQIREYFSAPAHLPWHRMANLDQWGGPLPRSYIDGQKALQVQILARARALGMTPVLGGFAGHVPEALKTTRPEAKISRIAPGWGGMPAKCATWFLDPTDPLFAEIQGRYLRKQTELYGTDHLYGTDPFNEIKPPSYEPDYLARVGKAIYSSMAQADPEAVWYQMAWTFYYDHQWTPERLKAMTQAVPSGKMVYLDYYGEHVELYPVRDSFYGAPFIWNYLGNFGGNSQIFAPLKRMAVRLPKALAVPNCSGIGSTLEGLGNSPVGYDFVLEAPWHPGGQIHLDEWIRDYAASRAGRPDPQVLAAWRLLNDKVFLENITPPGVHGSTLQSVPGFKPAEQYSPAQPPYRQAHLARAVEMLLAADPACRQSDGYRFDVVNFTRQLLANHLAVSQAAMLNAAAAKDLAAFRRESARFLELGRDLDTLMGTRHEFLLGRWIADARSWGTTPAEQDAYEYNARQIITTWHRPGGGLNDYACRQWNGLASSYYLGRWGEFVKHLEASLAEGRPFDAGAFTRARLDFETQWLAATGQGFATTPQGDPCETARRLFAKYRAELLPEPISLKLDKPAWSQASVPGTGELVWTYEATALVAKPGTYRVAFKYTAGQSALTIARVALVQDGRELAVDEHDGWTGHETRQNAYRLQVDQLTPGKPVSLVMTVQAASATDTAGTIDLQLVP